MSRLTKEIAEQVKHGLYEALKDDIFMHPNYLPNKFGGIWINDAQKCAYLRRMMESGVIQGKYHKRGWYKWYSYRRAPVETRGDMEARQSSIAEVE